MATFSNVYLPKNAYKTVRTVIDPVTQGAGRIAHEIPPNLGLNLLTWIQDAIDLTFITLPAPTTPEATTASNGLYLSTLDVRMGGALTENTTIDMTGFILNLDNNSLTLGDYGIGTHDPGSDPPYYLAVSATGVVQERTAAQILIDLGGPFTSTNIYNTSDSLTANRVVTQGAFSLQFLTSASTFTAGGGNVNFQLDPTGNVFRMGDYGGSANSTGITSNDATRQIKIGDITGAQNDTYVQVDDALSIVNINNELRLTEYGVGNYVAGVPAYVLTVSATGNVIESAVPSSFGQNIYNTNDTLTADRTLLGGGFEMDWDFVVAADSLNIKWAEWGHEIAVASATESAYVHVYPGTYNHYTVDAAGSSDFDTDGSKTVWYSWKVAGSIEGQLDFDGNFQVKAGEFSNRQSAIYITANTGAYLELEAATQTTQMGLYNNGAGGEIRLVSPAVVATTASLNDIWTNTNATTGAGEWVSASTLGLVDTGVYVGSGVVPTTVVATITDSISWLWTGTKFITFSDGADPELLYIRNDVNAVSGMTLRNQQGGVSSSARITVDTAAGGGDPSIYFAITGTTHWSAGIDNSDSDKFSISNSFNLGVNPALELATTGALQLNNYGVGTFAGAATKWLAVDVNGNVIEEAVPGGAQNLWLNMDADAGGPVAANTTTDTFTFVGGTGISTAISGDTVVITNTGAGAVTTASNGVLKLVNDVQLGNAAAGGALAADFLNDRFQFVDTFNYKFESSTGDILNIDGGTNFVMMGNNTDVPAWRLHLHEGGTVGGQTDIGTPNHMLTLQNSAAGANHASLLILAGTTGVASVYFGGDTVADKGQIDFDVASKSFLFQADALDLFGLSDVGAARFHLYGAGNFTPAAYPAGPYTGVYLLGVDNAGRVLEMPLSGGMTASQGITVVATDIRLGHTASGTSTHDFAAHRYLYTAAFDLIVNTPTNGNLFRIVGASDRIGIGVAAPDGTLHVMTATAGAITPDTAADDLIVENGANSGISILSPSANTANLYFGNPTWATAGKISWNQTATTLNIGTNVVSGKTVFQTDAGVNRMSILSTGQLNLAQYTGAGTFVGTAVKLLGVDASGNVIEEVLGGGGGDPDQLLWETFIADTGTTTANTITDTLTITGGTDIGTAIVGDTLTINYTGTPPAATNIYNTSDSLTGNRVLTGSTFSLNFNFDDGGGNTSTKTWQNNALSESITDGTSTAALGMTPINNTLSMSSTTANQTLIFNSAGSTYTMRNTFNATGERVDIIATAASASPSIIMQANNNAGNTSYYRSAVDGGGGVNLYARTTNVDGGTAVIGQVATLQNAGDGRWEWATPVTGDPDQNLWATVAGDAGSTTANTTTDTINIVGGTGISTAVAGDILTITNTSADTNTYLGNTNQTLTASRSIDLNSFQLDIQSAAVQTAVWGPGYQFGLQTGGGYYTDSATNYARFGHWSSLISPAEAGAYRRLKASPTILELYTTDGVTDVGYVRLTGATGAIESKNTQGSNISTITIDGASNTIDSTNGGGSYSRIITNGTTDTATIAVYDGTDTTTLTTSPTRTKASSAWVDSGIYNDVTIRIININNYSYTDMDKRRIVRYDSKAAHNMTGLDATAANAENGMIIELWNVGSSHFLVTNNDVLSLAANRILTPSGSSARVNSNGCAIFRYDTLGEGLGSPKWRLISSN